MTAGPERPDRVDVAIQYALRGWRVFPIYEMAGGRCSCGARSCSNPGKHPRTAHGLTDATASLGEIATWWLKWPQANIGLATGTHYVVLDVDPKSGGDETLRALEAEHGPLPETWRSLTGGGGAHIFFQLIPGMRNSASLIGPGLDIRADGGYIVAPGSDHASGRPYVWEVGHEPDDVPLAAMPQWMRDRLERPRGSGEAATDAEWVARLSGVGVGQRNATATQIAGHFARKGLTAGEIAEVLLGYGARCTPAIDRVEASQFRDIAKRIWEKERQKQQAEYREVDGRLCARVERDGQVTWSPICNFTARIVEEVLVDDGTDLQQRRLTIEGALDDGTILPTIEVTGREFANSLTWLIEQWGTGPIVKPGPLKREQFRIAVQTLSAPTKRMVYAHTGYVKRDDGSGVYLTSNGAVGGGQYDVDLGNDLNMKRYALPSAPEDVAGALNASLAVAELAADDIMLPLLATVWRAPLCVCVPCSFSVWIVGETGARKSTLAALMLSHYGDFPSKEALPMAWSWTANALEAGAFRLKDALTVIDDYAPDRIDPREHMAKALRIIRALGNVSARGRLGRDLTERPSRPPRGLVLSTGETFPPGESIAARTLIIPVKRGDVDIPLLSIAQKPGQLAKLAHGLAGYVGWTGQQLGNGLATRLSKKLIELRDRAFTESQHPRLPETIASLQLGWLQFLRFCVETNALTRDASDVWRKRMWRALMRVGQVQGALVELRQPHRVFLESLRDLLAGRRAVLLPRGTAPESVDVRGREIVGWHDDDWLYLIPKAAFREIMRMGRDAGEPLVVPEDQIERILTEAGIAEPSKSDGSTLVRVGGKPRRVLKLNRTAIERMIGPFDVPDLAAADTRERTGDAWQSRSPGEEPPF